MSWDYAQLSHAAKRYGGPAGLVAAIYDGGLTEGRVQGGAITGLMVLAAGGVALLIKRTVECKKAQAAAAKAILVDRLESKITEETEPTDESAQLDKTNSNGNQRLKEVSHANVPGM